MTVTDTAADLGPEITPGYICPACGDHVAFYRWTLKVGDWWRCTEHGCIVGAREIAQRNPGVPLPISRAPRMSP